MGVPLLPRHLAQGRLKSYLRQHPRPHPPFKVVQLLSRCLQLAFPFWNFFFFELVSPRQEFVFPIVVIVSRVPLALRFPAFVLR